MFKASSVVASVTQV